MLGPSVPGGPADPASVGPRGSAAGQPCLTPAETPADLRVLHTRRASESRDGSTAPYPLDKVIKYTAKKSRARESVEVLCTKRAEGPGRSPDRTPARLPRLPAMAMQRLSRTGLHRGIRECRRNEKFQLSELLRALWWQVFRK